ncbi:zinc finger protein 85-like isoform X2 [Esox lucius]|uniref:C2H2-type domain-containing protein n=1 Tax=Esox lucius TaxID=8010 RepID=A0AAY5K6H6_ESOLU|nr:zinc finger protein 85-like isoform X2 [Esox lucius]
MSKLQLFRLFLNERLTAAALEIFGAVERTVTEYQEENCRLRSMLSNRITADIKLCRIESQPLSLPLSELDIPPDEQPWSPHLTQEDPEPTQIKEEQEELRTSEEEEHLQVQDDVIMFKFPLPYVKSECGQEHQLQSTNLPQTLENRESDFKPFDLTNLNSLDISVNLVDNPKNAAIYSSAMSRGPVGLCRTHGGKPSVCPFCGKTFKQKNHLSRHLIIHTGKKPFSCSNCQKSFNRKETLTRHELIHTGEKSFCCADCGKRFNRKKRLTMHILTHRGEKPFNCGDCGKSFYSKQTLTRHNMTHTGEKPFSCGDCGRSFSRKEHLTGHIFAFH